MPNISKARPPSLLDFAAPKRRLLLVDDSDSVRGLLAIVLASSGFEVVVASDVNHALEHIAAETFDVLLSDLQMPFPGDGLTVVRAMRDSNPKAVTFIFSGFSEVNEAAKAILQQADEVLTKPMHPELLVKAINDRLKLGARAIPAEKASPPFWNGKQSPQSTNGSHVSMPSPKSLVSG